MENSIITASSTHSHFAGMNLRGSGFPLVAFDHNEKYAYPKYGNDNTIIGLSPIAAIKLPCMI